MFKRLFSESRMARECYVRFCEKFFSFIERFTHQKIIFVAIFMICLPLVTLNGKQKSIIGSDGTGFFVNYARVLNHIHHCRVNNKIPVVYWNSKSSYYDENGYNGSKNAWEYYFEPVSEEIYEQGDFINSESYWDNFSVLWDYHQYISNLHLLNQDKRNNFINVTHQNICHFWNAPVNGKHIYDEEFRSFVKKELIDPYIKVKPNIQEKVESFFQQNMAGKKTIGIHLRGRHLQNILPFVPIQVILEEANKLADNDTVFFIATDQYPLIKQAQDTLKGTVVFCDIERFEQTTSPDAGPKKLHPKLGEDVLVEALLLAQCDYLVHTISTVSTCVLYLNPTMKHLCLY